MNTHSAESRHGRIWWIRHFYVRHDRYENWHVGRQKTNGDCREMRVW